MIELTSFLGWVANILLIVGAWRLAYVERRALLLGVLGSALWGVQAALTCQVDLLSIEVILGSLQMWAWVKWGKNYDNSLDKIPT